MIEPAALPPPAPEMTGRLHELAGALVALQDAVPGLDVDEPGCLTDAGNVVDLEKGVVASYRPPGLPVEVRLLVSYRRVKLVTRTLSRPDVWTDLEDRLLLTLDEQPIVLGQRLESMEALAEALVRLARRRASQAVLPAHALRRERGVAKTPRTGRRASQRPKRLWSLSGQVH
jgi:hypothetical protein